MPLDRDGNIIIPETHPRKVFRAAGYRTDSGWKDLFRGAPTAMRCPTCNAPDKFRVMVDTDPDSGLFMLGCACGTWTKPFELRIPQMSDAAFEKLGFGKRMTITQDVDIPRSVLREAGEDV